MIWNAEIRMRDDRWRGFSMPETGGPGVEVHGTDPAQVEADLRAAVLAMGAKLKKEKAFTVDDTAV